MENIDVAFNGLKKIKKPEADTSNPAPEKIMTLAGFMTQEIREGGSILKQFFGTWFSQTGFNGSISGDTVEYIRMDKYKELEVKLERSISILEEILEGDSIECRGDEDCDHCDYTIRLEKLKSVKVEG